MLEGDEEPLDVVAGDAGAGVGDGEADLDAAVCQRTRAHRHVDASPRRELDGIAQQVEEHLSRALRIARQRLRGAFRDGAVERKPLRARQGSHDLDAVVDQAPDAEWTVFHGQLLRLQA